MSRLSLPAKIAIGVAVAVIALLVLAQLVVPGLAADKIEDRLTENGGEAEVSVDAFPAVLLAFGDGDAVEASGTGLDLELDTEDPEVFKRLDGFDRIDIALDDSRAGPFEIESFALRREGSGPYTLTTSATTTGTELLTFGAGSLGVPGSSLLGLITGGSEAANQPIPVELDMELESDDGRIMVTEGGGEIAGYPAGPLAELITSAIVVQL